MQSSRLNLLSRRMKAAVIAVMVVLLALFTWIAPPHEVWLHNVLHHLNILPFMLAGILLGWRAALKTLLLAVILQAPSIHIHWRSNPIDAQDQIVELSTFGTAGVIAGILADRERLQRLRVEATKRELERVHNALQRNIETMKKNERLSAAGQLAASLAHEIRNPLASISGATGILARGQASPASREECLEILTKESQRLNRLLTNFLDFARPRLPRLRPTDPAALIDSVLTLAQHAATRETIMITRNVPPALPEIGCDPELIKQVLLNLVLNAMQAIELSGTITVKAFATAADLVLEVRDNGRGIAPADRDRIFDPFFTTKENGTGLGLAVAANIVAQHGGTLTCGDNEHERGTTFRMQLPCASAETAPMLQAHPAEAL